jgi:tripartite-type tricarboxylate transporter receptor subunit TctC
MARLFLVLAVLFGSLAAASAQQERWPSRSITIVVPYSAGTAPDAIARRYGAALSARVGQPVVIENKVGAGGLIGTEFAALAPADGYTLFLGTKDTQAIIGHLYTRKNFDPVKAFAPISLLGRIVNVIVARPDLDIGSMKELIETSKKGRTLTFASPGVGTNLHLLGELIRLREGLNLTHVPYRNFGTAFTDCLAGRVDLVVAGLPPSAPLLQAKKLKALVTTGPARVPELPDTPTMAELGYQDLTFIGWFGLLAPAGTPAALIDRIQEETKQIVAQEEYRQQMDAMKVEAVATTPAEFAKLIDAESARLGELIRRVGIRAEP